MLSHEVQGRWLHHAKSKSIKEALRLFGLFAIAAGQEQLQLQTFSFFEKRSFEVLKSSKDRHRPLPSTRSKLGSDPKLVLKLDVGVHLQCSQS